MEKPHKKLDLWNVAMECVVHVYGVTEKFPKDERFGLTEQIRRSAVSIPSNIAEGAARRTKKEFGHYLHIAQGSLSELDTQLELAKRLGFCDERAWKDLDGEMIRIDKMLSGLIRRQRSLHA